MIAEVTREMECSTAARGLSAQAADQFLRDGYCRVPAAFSASIAQRVLEATLVAAERAGADLSRPSSPRLTVGRQAGPPFTLLNTERVWGALDHLVGKDRYDRAHFDAHGNFLLSFPGFTERRPSCQLLQWHVDNGYEKRTHYTLADGNCAIIPIFLLTPMFEQGGATMLMRGSHRWVARLIQFMNRPISEAEMMCLWRAISRLNITENVSLTGEPGDLVLVHPLTVHTGSPNYRNQLRVICNTGIGQLGPRRLSGGHDASFVERGIVDAITNRHLSARDRQRITRGVGLTNKLWQHRKKMIGALGVDMRRVGIGKRLAVGALDAIVDPIARSVADLIIPE